MITQSFLYNAIYFTYGLVLVKFYGVAADKVPLYGLAFAVGNLSGRSSSLHCSTASAASR